jgi:hypothetical protein
MRYTCAASGTWRSLVAHLLWEQGVASSNLAVPTNFRAGVAQLVEHQPSKLRVAGSKPVSRSTPLVRRPSASYTCLPARP